MKYLTAYIVLALIVCLFVSQTNAFFGKDSKKDEKGQCSPYKGKCGGTFSNGCCKVPYKCAKQTEICGKDKLCCVSEADIQRHKQQTGPWIKNRNG